MANRDYTEKIWIDEERKLEGICGDITLAARDGLNIVAIAHFDATLTAVGSMLRARSISFHTFLAGDMAALCSINAGDTPKLWLAQATYFQPRNFPAKKDAGEERLLVLVAEHHPKLSKDQSLLEGLACLPCKSRVVFHAALNDGLLLRFGGERLQSLLRQLGLEEGESLSHPLISGAIRRAQEKIDKKVRQEMPTRSAEEWFKYNLRE